MINRQTISSMNVNAKRHHGDLLSKIDEQRTALHRVHSVVEHIEDRMVGIDRTSQGKMDAISSKCEATHTSVMSLQHITDQLMGFVINFPQEICDLIHNTVRADWRTYQAVLQIQASLAHSPSSLHASNIQFTNALGEYRVCAFQICFVSTRSGFLSSQTFFRGQATPLLLNCHYNMSY